MTVVLNGNTGMTHYATKQYEEVFGSVYKLFCTRKHVYISLTSGQWGLVNLKVTCSKCRRKQEKEET